MNRLIFIKQLFVCMFTALLLCACEEENFDELYGSGSPLAENVRTLSNYLYEYNEKGLVTKILRVDKQQDDTVVLTDVATISYPRNNRAVMVYTEDNYLTTYTFAFGENHFANRIIDKSEEGTFLIKCNYDKEGHATSFDEGDDHLKMKWSDGNMVQITQDQDNATAILTYGDQTDFARYNMSPFLTDVDFSPNMCTLRWWYERGLYYALYIGFLGKPCQNLPETLISYDDLNPKSESYLQTFEYVYFDFDENPFGKWYLH